MSEEDKEQAKQISEISLWEVAILESKG